MKRKMYEIEEVRVDEVFLHLTVNGLSYRVRWADCSPTLAAASLFDKQDFEVSPSGYGISWLRLDVDLAVAPLLRQAEEVAPVEQTEERVVV